MLQLLTGKEKVKEDERNLLGIEEGPEHETRVPRTINQ